MQSSCCLFLLFSFSFSFFKIRRIRSSQSIGWLKLPSNHLIFKLGTSPAKSPSRICIPNHTISQSDPRTTQHGWCCSWLPWREWARRRRAPLRVRVIADRRAVLHAFDRSGEVMLWNTTLNQLYSGIYLTLVTVTVTATRSKHMTSQCVCRFANRQTEQK